MLNWKECGRNCHGLTQDTTVASAGRPWKKPHSISVQSAIYLTMTFSDHINHILWKKNRASLASLCVLINW